MAFVTVILFVEEDVNIEDDASAMVLLTGDDVFVDSDKISCVCDATVIIIFLELFRGRSLSAAIASGNQKVFHD